MAKRRTPRADANDAATGRRRDAAASNARQHQPGGRHDRRYPGVERSEDDGAVVQAIARRRPGRSGREPSDDEIRARAYQRYLERGGDHGIDFDDWVEAERELESETVSAWPRALWKGSISFGLVNIPIELHTAVRDHRPRFRMLHAKDKSPVRFERVCIRDGHPVAWEDLVKGYEYAKGHFVVLTKEDFQAAALEKTRTVDIIDFVKSDEIDDRFFETPYYLVPAKGGERAYALLREAIRESGPRSASRSSSCAMRSIWPRSR